MNKSCDTCRFAIFDETWGEWKCKARKVRIVNTETVCGLYIEKTKKESTNVKTKD